MARLRLPRSPRSPRRGGSAIEFGLTLPVLMIIFSAIVEYGWVFFHQSALLGAVRDGTRLGSRIAMDAVPSPETVSELRAKDVLTGYGLDCTNPLTCQVLGTVDQDQSATYWYLEVEIDRNYEPVMGLLPTPNQIHASMSMLIEQQVIQ